MYLSSKDINVSSSNFTDYSLIIPISIILALIGISIACLVIVVIASTKRLYTVTYLLICNTCISSIFYCVVQCNNYAFLNFILWDISDISCRWRGYFAYMSIVAVIYSYLIQAISRYFFVVLSMNYRWITSLKIHLILIAVQWIITILLPLPAIVTNDIYYAPNSLCWVRKQYPIHVAHTFLSYYFLPTICIVMLYVYLFRRAKRSTNSTLSPTIGTSRRQKRDSDLLRNILLLFSIYIFGGLPTLLYLVVGSNILYRIALIFVVLTVVVEKAATIFLDRELRKTIKHIFSCSKTPVLPIKVNTTNSTTARRTNIPITTFTKLKNVR
ncbi:unnamed protein product [Rotaria sp. Silwood1]|nr:unnamed protein product [Rotaria sp. Silwood1]CAF1560042.1 unnamed protein product [Rotaria sp. Silwood1]CAF3656188.1 unnamed protein product [Rotaria sp. Silwood1]CAF4751495.1 unnamed protein product [Rotaria sp. Silwood1]